tara:strand:+ start:3700 stop:6459 length:2760 start_codon:yes stop_codon:yes gene_type:complete
MKLPELSEVQFQASAQSQAFDPLKLPDPNPQLQQNLSIIQQSFANLAQSGKANAQADYGMQDRSFLEQFAELVPKAVNTAIQLQQVDVAIQQARADERFSQLHRSGALKRSEVYQNILDQSQRVDDVVKGQAGEAAQNGAGIDTVQGIFNFSNHGEIRLKQKLANHLVTNHYPEWAQGQRLTNDTEIPVNDENGNQIMVRINDQDQPIFIDRQIRTHLRTAFLGHSYMADTNNELLTDAFAVMHKIDDQLEAAYDKQYRAKVGKKQFADGFNTAIDRIKTGDMKGLAVLFQESKGIWTKDGTRPMQRADFFERLLSTIKTTTENGAEYDIPTLLTVAEFSEDGQTMMQRAPRQAALIAREYRDTRRVYLANKLKADTQDLKFAIAEFGAPNPDDPKSVSDFVAFKTTVRQRAAELGIDASDMLKVIDQQIRVGSMGADEMNQLREQAEIALQTGNASQNADYYLHPVVGPEVREKVDKQVERKKTPEYTSSSKQISDLIGSSTKGTMVDPEGKLKGQAIGVNRHYQLIYDNKYDELMQTNLRLDPKDRLTNAAIADQARDTAIAQWEKDSKNSQHKYYVNPKNGNFDNYPVAKENAIETQQNNTVRAITSGASNQKGVLTQIAAEPSRIMLAEGIRQSIETYSTTGEVDAHFISLQKKINQTLGKRVIQNPMQIVIAAAQGYGILKPGEVPQSPAYLQVANTTKDKRKLFAELVGLKGKPLYTNPVKYGPTQEMPVRSAFQGVVQPTTPNRPSTQVVKNPISTLVTEGEGQYDSMYPNENYPEMLDMEIRTELVAFQKEKLKDGRDSGAVGTHQFLYPERAADLAGLPADAKFTPENQERMFMATLLNKPGREAIAAFLKGNSTDVETAIDQMSMEFASIEYRNGESYYKDGINKAKITRDRVREALIATRDELMRGNQ